jgi:peptidoglycan/xylan/chitin deacetylase (PgdA/CDA1 family)
MIGILESARQPHSGNDLRVDRQCQPRTADWRQLVAEGLYRTGLLRALQGISQRYELTADDPLGRRFRRVQKAKYVVLGYHRVGTEGVPLFCSLPQSVFAAQMEYVRQHFRVLSVRQMAEELAAPEPPGQAVVVTFDDGYLGTFTEAFPVLQAYNIPATVYLTAGAVESGEISWYDRIFLGFFKHAGSSLQVMLDKPRTFILHGSACRIDAATEVVMYLRSIPDNERRNWCSRFEQIVPLLGDELRGSMMSWDQIRLMQRAGFSFGAHTMTHPVASRLAPEALRNEVAESKWLIEQRLSSPIDEFAFPFGKPRDCGAIGSAELKELGFRTALTTIIGVNKPGTDMFRLRRLVIGNDTSIARFALTLHQLFFHSVDEELSGHPRPTDAWRSKGIR